jgi:hypothetical protein
VNSAFLLYDLLSGNIITSFATEPDAWDALRRWASDDRLESIHDLALSSLQGDCETPIAMDDDLVQRVARDLQAAPGVEGEGRADTPGRIAS